MKELPSDAIIDYGSSVETLTELPSDAIIDYTIAEEPAPMVQKPVQQPVRQPVQQPLADQPNYADTALNRLEQYPSNIADALSKRNLELGQTQRDYEQGKINLGEWALQTVGKGLFGSIADIAGETAATVLSALTPDEAEQQVKDWVAAGANNVMSTESAQELLEFYQGLDPNTRKNIESATNIAAVYAPKGISKTGKALTTSGKRSQVQVKKDKLAETVLDTSTKGKELRATNPNLVKMDEAILNTLLDVKGIKPGAKPSVNISAIDTELGRLDAKLLKELSGIEGVKVSGNLLKKNIPLTVAKRLGDDPVFSDPSLKKVSKTIENLLFNDKGGYIGNKSLSVADIAQARRNLDKGLKKLRGGQSDASKMFVESGANGDIIRAYRDVLNEIVDGLAKNADVDTSAIRTRQSHLLSAKTNLGKAAAKKEGKSGAQKVIDYAKSHPFVVGSAIGAATGGTGGMIANPAVIGAGAGLLGGIGAYKATTSPLTRIATGAALQSQIPTATAAASLYGSAPDESEQQLLNR
jgi:ElaB/YqjD/DUF883 family membrane-anchored ribosome-binding protein